MTKKYQFPAFHTEIDTEIENKDSCLQNSDLEAQF